MVSVPLGGKGRLNLPNEEPLEWSPPRKGSAGFRGEVLKRGSFERVPEKDNAWGLREKSFFGGRGVVREKKKPRGGELPQGL